MIVEMLMTQTHKWIIALIQVTPQSLGHVQGLFAPGTNTRMSLLKPRQHSAPLRVQTLV